MTLFANGEPRTRDARRLFLALTLGISCGGSSAFAQEPPLSLVPSIGVASTPSVAPREPVQQPPAAAANPAPRRKAAVSWNAVTPGTPVPLSRANFDNGGYQLFDTAGGSIRVPFANNDVHVMKFAVSPDNTTFFVNDGTAPVLHIPRDICLYNTAVPGARWYPFSARFSPVRPVFFGIAPSYSEYVQIGWLPNTITYGGFYGTMSYTDGGVFRATTGLTFYVGTQSFGGWSPYRDFAAATYQVEVNRPRASVRRPQDYPNNTVYHDGRTDFNGVYGVNTYGYGGYPYPNDGYRENIYLNPYGGYTRSDSARVYTFPSGGFGFPGGGYGYPGGGASSGTPGGAPPRGGMPGARLPEGGTPGARLPRGGMPGSF